ncbi:hypothetical protein GRJ2_003434600 [Grus japonensis]|uniref:RNase H type-1 domain-containing protein n=1 Tax=Grus japonensis TaxID=30415 RepID=A0ABC9YJB7_GRUJA
MRKDFSRLPGEHIITWLLCCWDNGASSLELEGREAKQLGSLSREGGIDKAIGKKAQALSLWRRLLSSGRERYPFSEDVVCRPGKWTTMERVIDWKSEEAPTVDEVAGRLRQYEESLSSSLVSAVEKLSQDVGQLKEDISYSPPAQTRIAAVRMNEGSERAALVGTWPLARVNPPQQVSEKGKKIIQILLQAGFTIKRRSPNRPGILEVITDWPEGKDFGMSPEEEVTRAEEAPPYNKLTEDEKPYALFTDGSCHIVGKHRRWKAAVWSPTQRVAEAAEGQGESSQFAEVKAIQLALDIAE